MSNQFPLTGISSVAMHTAQGNNESYAHITPIYATSTFVFDGYQKPKEHDYTRTSNPTRNVLEDTIAALEGGNHGFAFSSGMSAVASAIHILSAGDHVISCDDLYGGSHRLFEQIMTRFGITAPLATTSTINCSEAKFRYLKTIRFLSQPLWPYLVLV